MTLPKREFEVMTCMGGCGRRLPWPDCYPERMLAICFSCAWRRHIGECPMFKPKRRWFRKKTA